MSEQEVKIKVSINKDEIKKALKEIGDESKGTGDKVENSFSGLSSGLGSFTKMLNPATVGVAAVGAAIVGLGVGLYNLAEKAFESEASLNKLTNVLMATGEGTRETAEEIANMADQIEKTTGIQAESIQNQISYAVSMGFSKDEAVKLTNAAMDLAAATGDSLDGATRKLIGTYQGVSGQLGRQIDGFKELTKEQLMSGEGVDFIAKKFEGFSRGAAQNLETRIKIMGHAFGDIAETFGTVVNRNDGVNTSVTALTETFKKANIIAGNMSKAFDSFLNTVLTPMAGVINNINAALDKYIQKQNDASNGLKPYRDNLERAQDGLFKLQQQYENMSKSLEGRKIHYPFDDHSESQKRLDAIKSQIDDYVYKVKTASEELQKKENYIKWQSGDSLGGSAPAATSSGSTRGGGESEEAKKAREAKAKADEDAAQQSFDRQKAMSDQVYAMEYADLLRKGEIEGMKQGMFQSRVDYEEEVLTQLDEGKITRFDADIALYGEQNALEMQALQQKITAAELAGNAKEAEALRGEAAQKRLNVATKARIDNEVMLEKQKEAAVAGILSNLSGLMASSNRKAFEVGKAAAIAQAVMNTYQGITKALASAPPPFNFALAATVGAAGFMQIAQIRAQQPPKMANGGTIGMDGKLKSSSAYGDQAMFMGNRGEDVLNLKEQRVLKRYIGSGSSLNSELLASIENKIGQAPIIYMNTSKVSEEVSNEQNRSLR